LFKKTKGGKTDPSTGLRTSNNNRKGAPGDQAHINKKNDHLRLYNERGAGEETKDGEWKGAAFNRNRRGEKKVPKAGGKRGKHP